MTNDQEELRRPAQGPDHARPSLPQKSCTPPLRPWMRFVLRFAGTYNLLAGAAMICLYHEGYKLLGMRKPELILPVQVMGILVGLFGVGYHLVASNPVENRNILALGFWSKALSSIFALYYVAVGTLPVGFLPVLFFSDIVYLPPFYLIWRRISRLAA
jgi:small multidrug resistance pump